jgi:hypothetical protein
MAQAIAACEFDPYLVRKGKEGLFDERYYRSIFGRRSLSFYLSRYWLMRQVQSAAYGHPERAYAKWLVLNFVWKQLSRDIEHGIAEQRFRYACEHNSDNVLFQLRRALEDTFRASLRFYRLERGKGEEAKDVSTFFKLAKLDKRFSKYWVSSKNSYRKKVEERIRKFSEALNDVDISDE